MGDFFKYIFSDFWMWLGFIIILGGLSKFIFRMYNRTLRHRNILKHGYPPAHCDADGDFPDINEDDDSDDNFKVRIR